jgi:Chlamydia polymorphic membrane protein (Chlamydia_PMP) repeat
MTTTNHSIVHVLLAPVCCVFLLSACAGTADTDTTTSSAAPAPLTLAAKASVASTSAGAALDSGSTATPPAAPPPPTSAVGTGTATSCTEAAFAAALLAGGTVTFNCGGQATIIITSPKSVANTVTVDGGSAITLSGNHQSRLFDVTSAGALTLQNITLDQAFGTTNGVAIASHGTLTMNQVSVTGAIGQATSNGGAVYTDGPLTTITGSTFNSNTAGAGGALFIDTSAAVANIYSSTFISNSAQNPTAANGGAIVVSSFAHLYMRDSLFLFNQAQQGGALFVARNAVVDIFGSPTTPPQPSAMQFNGNTATLMGGAIFNQGSDLYIGNTSFSTNSTPQDELFVGYGGAIASFGTLSLADSIVYGNQARFGGGLYVSDDGQAASFANIVNTEFKLNSAGGTSTGYGGGLLTEGSLLINPPTVYITGSAFDYNTSGGIGGGLGRYDSDLHIENSSFTNNTAASVGGGLSIVRLPSSPYEPYIRIQSVTISGNSAAQGGGVYNWESGIEMYNTTIAGNTGGGVFTDSNGNSRLRSSVLQNPGYPNCAIGSSGGSYSDDQGNFTTDASCPLPQSLQGNPLLGPLTQDPAGVTSFLKPQPGSLLIDNGYSCPLLDQIGASRIGACDIGAVEAGARFHRPIIPIRGGVAFSAN